MKCKICGIRRPRRYCPGVSGDICPQCCGTEREVTISCPFDCEYLREARKRDKHRPVSDAALPDSDINVTEQFMRDQERLSLFLSMAVLRAALSTAGAVDNDVREAIDAAIRTYRTMGSGLIYETKPTNPVAGAVSESIQLAAREFQKEQTVRDVDILGVLVFIRRIEAQDNNGRPKGRAFIDLLRGYFPEAVPPAAATSLIL